MSKELMEPLKKEMIDTKFGKKENFDITVHTDYRRFVEIWNYVTDIPFKRNMTVIIPNDGECKLSYNLVPLTKTEVTKAFREYQRHTEIPFVVNPHMSNRRLFKAKACAIFIQEFVEKFLVESKKIITNPEIDIDDEDTDEETKM